MYDAYPQICNWSQWKQMSLWILVSHLNDNYYTKASEKKKEEKNTSSIYPFLGIEGKMWG